MLALFEVAQSAGMRPKITSTIRSRTTQARLYRLYVTGRSAFPAAPPGTSKHERGLAFDMSATNLPALGALWESWGGRWGGRYRDPIHFEV